MSLQFKTILIPVDFSQNTALAITKCLDICSPGSVLHLFHVQKFISSGLLHHYILGYSQRELKVLINNSEHRLEQIKQDVEKKRPDISVRYAVSFGDTIEESIIQKALRLNPDLIIIGKHRNHSLLPFLNTIVPSKLVTSTGSPVLTIKPGALEKNIKTVVIPVSKTFPVRKMEILHALRKKTMFQIKLVTFSTDESDPAFSFQPLLSVFRLLKGQISGLVHHDVLDGSNKGIALLKYCNQVEADILIVHAQSETHIKGFVNRHLTDLLPPKSKTQILAVQPW